jgi:hypothetical protein
MQPDLDAAPDQGANQKLTRPLRRAVKFSLVLAAAGLGIVLLFALLGTTSFRGQGTGLWCSLVPLNGTPVTSTAVAHLRPGATIGSTVTLCASHPDAGQRVLWALTWAPSFAFGLAVLLLLVQLLRAVRSAGPFAMIIAQRLRFLGWFVLAGSLIVAVGQGAARNAFTSTLFTGSVPALKNTMGAGLGGILGVLLIACGLLTLARVIRAGAQMSDDLAGTV